MITPNIAHARFVRRLSQLERRAEVALGAARSMEEATTVARLLMRCHRRWEPVLAAYIMSFG